MILALVVWLFNRKPFRQIAVGFLGLIAVGFLGLIAVGFLGLIAVFGIFFMWLTFCPRILDAIRPSRHPRWLKAGRF